MCVIIHTTLLRGVNPQLGNRQRRTQHNSPHRDHEMPQLLKDHQDHTRHNMCQEGVPLFHLTPYLRTSELRIMGTWIPFGRRTWRAKWGHGEEHSAQTAQGTDAVPAAAWALGVWEPQVSWHWPFAQQGPMAQAADGHSEIQQEPSLSWKPPDFQTQAVKDIKPHSLLCSGSLPRGTSSSCYFDFAPPLNFKDLDAWDIHGKPGLRQ